MTTFTNRYKTIDEYIKDNPLNGRLVDWIENVNIDKQTGGKKYAFTSAKIAWNGKPYDLGSFVSAYVILQEIEDCFVLSTCDDERAFKTKIGNSCIANPFYFTWAVIYAYLMIDDRFVNNENANTIKYQMRCKLSVIHQEAFLSLEKLIYEELLIQVNNKIAEHNGEVSSANSSLNVCTELQQSLNAVNADAKTQKPKKNEKEMMGVYFSKIAYAFLDKTKKKTQKTREGAKECLQSIMSALRLHKFVSDDLQDAIDNFDNEEPQPLIVKELVQTKYVENEIQNVETGATGVAKYK